MDSVPVFSISTIICRVSRKPLMTKDRQHAQPTGHDVVKARVRHDN